MQSFDSLYVWALSFKDLKLLYFCGVERGWQEKGRLISPLFGREVGLGRERVLSSSAPTPWADGALSSVICNVISKLCALSRRRRGARPC
ncbi:unknown protein [Desulfotalea psychrophila LSv54]|uniref:Uncharacterized protein n=1 Tax=Desulfotalea psychrophila (strain LSv54 / DSM 12343) TaxID=177439 RepID=Q6APL8_DESPS|nr:unknown protein [Desulfotalea psychrophila LSv54]